MNISIKIFTEKFYNMKNKDLAKELGISEKTLGSYARKLNLRKRAGYCTKPKLKLI